MKSIPSIQPQRPPIRATRRLRLFAELLASAPATLDERCQINAIPTTKAIEVRMRAPGSLELRNALAGALAATEASRLFIVPFSPSGQTIG